MIDFLILQRFVSNLIIKVTYFFFKFKEFPPSLSYVQTIRFFVRLIACVLVGNRMPPIENRMRYATISVDYPHDASVSSCCLSWDVINLLGNAFRLWLTTFA